MFILILEEHIRPPIRFCASNTIKSFILCCDKCVAAARPAMPAPIIITLCFETSGNGSPIIISLEKNLYIYNYKIKINEIQKLNQQ